MRRVAALALVAALAGAVSAAAPAERERAWTRSALVVGVVSGDTVDARLATGELERVRLLGVRAPGAADCYGTRARAATRALVGGRRVRLAADRAVPGRDAAGRLLAYVAAPRGLDLGRALLGRGLAQIDATDQGFARFLPYVPVQRAAEGGRGVWRACSADLEVAVAASPTEPAVGAQVTYAVTVTNRGPLGAPGAVLELRPPGATPLASTASRRCRVQAWVGTCSFGRLAPHAVVTATFTADVTRAGPVSARAAARFDWCIRTACGSAPLRDADPRNGESAALVTAVPPAAGVGAKPPVASACHPSYPTVCIPPPPPALVCADIPYRDFSVRWTVPDPDPHRFDKSEDGIGCQFDDY